MQAHGVQSVRDLPGASKRPSRLSWRDLVSQPRVVAPHVWKCPLCHVTLSTSQSACALKLATTDHWQELHADCSRKSVSSSLKKAQVACANSRLSRAQLVFRTSANRHTPVRLQMCDHLQKSTWTCAVCTAINRSSLRLAQTPCDFSEVWGHSRRWLWWRALTPDAQRWFASHWNVRPPESPVRIPHRTAEEHRRYQAARHKNIKARKRRGTYTDQRGRRNRMRRGIPIRHWSVSAPVRVVPVARSPLPTPSCRCSSARPTVPSTHLTSSSVSAPVPPDPGGLQCSMPCLLSACVGGSSSLASSDASSSSPRSEIATSTCRRPCQGSLLTVVSWNLATLNVSRVDELFLLAGGAHVLALQEHRLQGSRLRAFLRRASAHGYRHSVVNPAVPSASGAPVRGVAVLSTLPLQRVGGPIHLPVVSISRLVPLIMVLPTVLWVLCFLALALSFLLPLIMIWCPTLSMSVFGF